MPWPQVLDNILPQIEVPRATQGRLYRHANQTDRPRRSRRAFALRKTLASYPRHGNSESDVRALTTIGAAADDGEPFGALMP